MPAPSLSEYPVAEQVLPDVAAQRTLSQLLMGNRIQQAIYVAAKIGIADLLKNGPKTAADLASAIDCNSDAVYRLLRALAGYGIFAEEEDHRFALTPMARLLQSGSRGSLKAAALWSGTIAYPVFGGLEYSVRTGLPTFDQIFGAEFFEYLAANPDLGALFDEFMARQTAMLVSSLPALYDFSGTEIVADIGGGRGELLAAILRSNPGTRGLLLDQPRVIAKAAMYLEEAGVSSRCQTIAGNLSEGVPYGADLYLLKSIVHSGSDETAITWLRNCRRAMTDQGRLLLVEYVIPSGNDPHPGKMMDVLMLLGTHGGRERTEGEFKSLLAAADFSLARIIPTETFYSVIEALPIPQTA